MPRRALYAVMCSSACVLGGGCGSDSGSRPSASAGAATGGQAGGSMVAAGASAQAGSAAGGQPSAGAASGGAPSAGAAGTAGTGTSAGGPAQTGTPLVYVGGFGDFPLRVYELNKQTGVLSQRGVDEDAGSSPSYLAFDPSGTHLYNVNEDAGAGAGVTAHRVKADGTLEPLNHRAGSDATPQQGCNGSCGFTHLAVAPGGQLLVAASYDGGSVSLFPIAQDGSLEPEKQLLEFGNRAQAHSVAFDSAGKFAFVPTLGLDEVQQLLLSTDGTLSANTPPSVASAAGAGPRHIAMHPNGKLVFVINETASTLTPYALSGDGKLTPGNSVSTLPAGFSGESYGQHVEVSPNGRFVYASNVGHDSIAAFAVEPASGALSHLQDQPSGGAWPRDFEVDPNGDVLVVANRDSNSLCVFALGTDGKLTPLGPPTSVPAEPTSVVLRYNK